MSGSRYNRLGPAALAVLALVLNGCSSGALRSIRRSLIHYHEHIKEQRMAQAMAYVAPEAWVEAQNLHSPRRNTYVLVDYAVDSVVKDPKADRFVVLVAATVARRDSVVVKRVTLRETWEKRSGRYLLVDEEMETEDGRSLDIR